MAAVLFASRIHAFDDWAPSLRAHAPQLDLRRWPDAGDPADIDVVLVWNPLPEVAQFPNLRLVQCLGAGVDHLAGMPIPAHVPLARLVDSAQVDGFVHFVLAAVLGAHRDLHRYRAEQAAASWAPRRRVQAKDRTVGVMGLGEMGAPCARELARLGFKVKGWSLRDKRIDGVSVFAGAARLSEFLSDVDILVCALPLTDETRGILNTATFAQLALGAYVINVGRGGHCVEADLVSAVNDGWLSGALLDVVNDEPLAATSALWRTPGIEVTPHIATSQVAGSAAAGVAANIARVRQGLSPLGLVDRAARY